MPLLDILRQQLLPIVFQKGQRITLHHILLNHRLEFLVHHLLFIQSLFLRFRGILQYHWLGEVVVSVRVKVIITTVITNTAVVSAVQVGSIDAACKGLDFVAFSYLISSEIYLNNFLILNF